MEVIKRDGRREIFNEGKVRRSIEGAGRDAHLSDERIKEITSQIIPGVLRLAADKEEITTAELKKFILNQLDEIEPAAAEAWRAYNEARGK